MSVPSRNPVEILKLESVSKRFGGTVALNSIDWTIVQGEIHCLVGENGSGKSTLIKIVSGVHDPDTGGKIFFDGKSYAGFSPHLARMLGIQVIYQDLSLFPNLCVWENIAIHEELGAPLGRIHRNEMRNMVAAALSTLSATISLDAKVGQLPIAERQIVAICRGIAAKARILFMDEPTASLAHHEVVRLIETVRRLKDLGLTIVFVSHRLEEVIGVADRLTVLRDGQKVATLPAQGVDHHQLTELMTGSRISHVIKNRAVKNEMPVLQVVKAGRKAEFDDVSFSLMRGEVVGIVGLMGSGRTELALSLFGMTPLHRGEIRVDGDVVSFNSNRDAIRAGLAYVSEDRLQLGLNLKQSIADNASITLLNRLANLFGLVAPRLRRNLAARWIDKLGIKAPNADVPVNTLSGGNQQRIVLAKWLATSPKVLILDSPTAGVDVRNKQGIYDIIHDLAEQGMAIIMISDEISEVYYNADRILHMRGGRLKEQFKPTEIDEISLAGAVFA